MNKNVIKDIFIISVVIWLVVANAHQNYILTVSSGIGLIVLILGIVKIYNYKMYFSNLNKKLFFNLSLSVFVALISLIFWGYLFHLKKFYIIQVDTSSVKALWALNTGIYFYLMLSVPTENFIKKAHDALKNDSNH